MLNPDDKVFVAGHRGLVGSALVRRLFRRVQQASAAAPRSATSIAAALEFCRKVLPRRAVLFLVSDFLDDGYLQALRSAGNRHDLVAALVTDPREREMAPAGLVTLVDAETGATRLVDTTSPAFRDELAAAAAARLAGLERELAGSGVDLFTIDATQSVVDPLLRFLRQRERRTRR